LAAVSEPLQGRYCTNYCVLTTPKLHSRFRSRDNQSGEQYSGSASGEAKLVSFAAEGIVHLIFKAIEQYRRPRGMTLRVDMGGLQY